KLPGGRVIPNDLEAANTDGSDPAVRGMHDEVAARCPLIDVARHDGLRWSAILWGGLTLCQPAADEHVQSFQLRNRRGDHHGLLPKKRRRACRVVAGHCQQRCGTIVDAACRGGYLFRSEVITVPGEREIAGGSTAQDTSHGVKAAPANQQLNRFLTAR